MALIDLASFNSLWRGMDYFELNKVKEIEEISDNEYKSIVSGSSDYNVFINLNHPRKSNCSCPFAEGFLNFLFSRYIFTNIFGSIEWMYTRWDGLMTTFV